jgi:hypothetical protein
MIAIFGAIVLGNAPVGACELGERRSWPEADADQEQDDITSG